MSNYLSKQGVFERYTTQYDDKIAAGHMTASDKTTLTEAINNSLGKIAEQEEKFETHRQCGTMTPYMEKLATIQQDEKQRIISQHNGLVKPSLEE